MKKAKKSVKIKRPKKAVYLGRKPSGKSKESKVAKLKRLAKLNRLKKGKKKSKKKL